MQTLNDIEKRIMTILFTHQSMTSREIANELTDKPIAFSTLSFALRTLEHKGMVEHVKVGNTYHYSPRPSRSDVILNELTPIIERYFNGHSTEFVRFVNVQMGNNPADKRS